MSLFNELKRRNVFRVAAAYLVSAWLLIEIGALLFEAFQFPAFAGKLLIIVLGLGFIPTVIFAWAFELTPEGIKRESQIDRNASITHHTGRRLDQITIAMILLALGVIIVERFILESRLPSPAPQAVEVTSQPAPQPQPVRPPLPGRDGPPPPPNSMAVLPFVNMSADPDNEFFADGIAEEILNVLARVDGLKVAARTSSFAFKDREATTAEIAAELGVAHVLEGSVRKQGDRVRVTAQLIQAENGFHLWSENFDRQLTDIFAIQDEIADSILRRLVAELTGEPLPPTTERLTDDPQAYELFLRARHFWRMRNATALRQAVDLFEQATTIDPQFDRAWSGLAIAWQNLDEYDPQTNSEQALEDSRVSAERAVAINPDNGEALAALASLMITNCQMIEGMALYDRAVQADPRDPTVWHWRALRLKELGLLKDASKAIDRARELDPVNTAILSNVSEVAELQGDIEIALQTSRAAAELGFRDGSRLFEGLILANAGRLGEAEGLLRADTAGLDDLNPQWADHFLAALRDPAALGGLETVLAESDDPWVVPEILARAGSRRLLDSLVGCDGSSTPMIWHPAMKAHRATPEFMDAMERMGFVEYWRRVQWPDQCADLDPELADCPSE